jgi:hypothetical protein
MTAVMWLITALGACGEPTGAALGSAQHLFVEAHQDDLLFMQPDLYDALDGDLGAVGSNVGVTTVFITAGDDGHGTSYADRRNDAARAAYDKVTKDSDWSCGWIQLAGHTAQSCHLQAENDTLVFLGYPDGGIDGSAAHSLLQLWEGNIEQADTVADEVTSYNQQGLIDALAAVITAVQPGTVHTLEIASTHGEDHSDHMLAGALTLLAMAQAGSTAELFSYRGYNTQAEPANKPANVMTASELMLTAYGEDGIASEDLTWLARRYAVGFRLAVAGALRTGGPDGQCLLVESDGSIIMGDCSTAPAWHLDSKGELADETGHCLDTVITGEVIYDSCTGGIGHRFFVDDEGHVWASIVPAAAPDMSYAHLTCLATGGGGVHAALCGQGGAPTWDFVPTAVQTPRATLGFAATGRQVRIGDVNGDANGDLCAVVGSALECAAGDGSGGFGSAATVIDSFPVDPESLAIGSTMISTPGNVLMCGLALDGSGPSCTLVSPAGGTPQTWGPAFAGPVAGTSASLAISSDGQALTALTSAGVEYASHSAQASVVVSSWPAAGDVVWTAPLDRDAILGATPWQDFCVAGATGPLCMPGNESELTGGSAGVPWGFSLAGVPDASPQDPDTGALADIDGDGRADLCGLDLVNARVACARSQGRGFGPLTTLFALPAGITPTALWLGDLNGDGKADACVDGGATVVCAISP